MVAETIPHLKSPETRDMAKVHVSAQSMLIWDLKVQRPKLLRCLALKSQGGKYSTCMNMKGTGVSQSRPVGIRCGRGTSGVCY